MLSFKEILSGFFPWKLPVVKISPEWVTGPEQGKSEVGLLPLASGPACLGTANTTTQLAEGIMVNI